MFDTILHVYYTGKPEDVRTFIREMQAQGLQKLVLEEDGCLQYDYFLSCQEEGSAVLVERWRDGAALEKHLSQPHMDRVRALQSSCGLTTQLNRYQVSPQA